ncbi:YdeI/OmpD-associated family protein [Algoriphagus mannitolivorans]|uniref:YdeI/OmpD-associated family protein n=1 Tax=Algoriphagus mannitolivorans TaxID=226504 RepID=UPI00041F4B27|nr:YdeI/OmpD-associated family protein [Algoriphagus mannitolivorans]
MPKNTQWNELENHLRQLVSTTPLTEEIKWGMPVFTFEGKNVLGFAGMKNHFAVWFYNGVFLTDTEEILINAQEGKTKAMRQWRMLGLEDLDDEKFLAFVKEAIENEKKGLVWKPDKSEKLSLPDILEAKLKSDPQLKKAFEEFTPFKQKEFAEYIQEAKREATKVSRLEKIIPMILEGIGLNDKYR